MITMPKNSCLTLYHGSRDVIEHPIFGYGAKNNDYGLGFYCTESPEIAKEWACTRDHEGYANKYSFKMSDMRVLNLCSDRYCTLNWLTILLENRTFDSSAKIRIAKEYLISNYGVDYKSYDVIRGYRADDAYFAFVRMFLDNSLTLESLEMAMHLGKLGEQIVIKSKAAFDRLEFVSAEKSCTDYLKKRTDREESARRDFFRMCENDDKDGTYLMDIIRRG